MSVVDAVDIVVLNCNDTGHIEKCVESIFKNTDGIYNLIIVDQNSEDGSREWLIENKIASHLILNTKNAGVAEGRNQGIKVGKYPWIAFIDSDIEIKDPLWLDKMWNYTIDRNIGFIESRIKVDNEWKFGELSFCLARRKCFNEIGLFDKEFFLKEDSEWFVRLEWSKWKVAYCYDTNIFHNKINSGNSSLLKKQYLELLRTKYTSKFLDKTVGENFKRREIMEKELL